jgi:predicted nucleic-acid-binding protein
MVTSDTNVIVRLFTKDDEKQYKIAYSLFQREEVYIPLTVLLETEWVLRFSYKFAPEEILKALRLLSGLGMVEIESPQDLLDALDWYADGMDFADALHLAVGRRADRFATFDKKLVAKAKKLVDFPVDIPS